jgi:hypothetical protein
VVLHEAVAAGEPLNPEVIESQKSATGDVAWTFAPKGNVQPLWPPPLDAFLWGRSPA